MRESLLRLAAPRVGTETLLVWAGGAKLVIPVRHIDRAAKRIYDIPEFRF